ncbi:unnamed protein product [Toxocara canis]|uniref:Alba domain-containing protein n=1 Tax=Toxocara canis TaxID=6265 RepID=A0A183TYM9_TOXCA|nr:unnamed protein product [Toxocara canis]
MATIKMVAEVPAFIYFYIIGKNDLHILKASGTGRMTRDALDALTGACAAPNWKDISVVLVTATPVLTPLKFFNDQCNGSRSDDNTEVRALVVDDIEGMVPRIITNLGKAAFWMDKRPTETILATNSSP